MRTFRSSGKDAQEREALTKQIEDLDQRLDQAEREHSRITRENRELKAEVKLLEIRLAESQIGGDFVMSHGVLWQRAANGLIEPFVYCPSCRLVMTPLPSGYPEYLVCTQCKFKASFHPSEIPELRNHIGEE